VCSFSQIHGCGASPDGGELIRKTSGSALVGGHHIYRSYAPIVEKFGYSALNATLVNNSRA
jgi:hypothetical protein